MVAPVTVAHNCIVLGRSILCFFACSLYLAVALPLAAQSVTAVSNSSMEFSDPAFGVSFRFPSGWSFSRVDPGAQSPALAIAWTENRTVSTGLRGLITNETLHGLHAWPRTVFSSVEFAYDARPAVSADACRQLAQQDWQQETDPIALDSVTFWHGTASNDGLSTEVAEDIYAAFLPAPGACLRFDLAVATSHVPGRDYPRELTGREQQLIHQSLSNILDSVQITSPVR